MTALADYRLDIYDTSGDLQFVLTDFASLHYAKRVNHPGIVQFGVYGYHSLLDSIADKWHVEVWRKPSGGSWGREITGLYRMLSWAQSDKPVASVFCNGLMSILGWRHIAWTAGYANRSAFAAVAAETIANTLVSYNACANATIANGREREGAITGLTVEADGAAGTALDWYCAYDNLLESLQELCKLGDGDFDVVKTSSTAWQWRWYEGQLGTDRSATVTFALGYGNMADPVYVDNRTGEKTVAIVGGQGENADRAIAVTTGTNYNVNTNNIEMFVAATDVTTTDGLTDRGNKELANTEAVKEFGFKVIQTEACKYGTHYVLGDKVTAVNPFTETTYTQKVQAVSVSFSEDGDEQIAVELSTPL